MESNYPGHKCTVYTTRDQSTFMEIQGGDHWLFLSFDHTEPLIILTIEYTGPLVTSNVFQCNNSSSFFRGQNILQPWKYYLLALILVVLRGGDNIN